MVYTRRRPVSDRPGEQRRLRLETKKNPKVASRYSRDSRAEAIKLVLEQGLSLAEVARRLSIGVA